MVWWFGEPGAVLRKLGRTSNLGMGYPRRCCVLWTNVDGRASAALESFGCGRLATKDQGSGVPRGHCIVTKREQPSS